MVSVSRRGRSVTTLLIFFAAIVVLEIRCGWNVRDEENVDLDWRCGKTQRSFFVSLFSKTTLVYQNTKSFEKTHLLATWLSSWYFATTLEAGNCSMLEISPKSVMSIYQPGIYIVLC